MFRILFAAFFVAGIEGCNLDYIPNTDVTTTSPTNEQVQYCRDVMYINPDLEIQPVGYSIRTGLDDEIRFKFIAQTNDPSQLFDTTHVDSQKFLKEFNPSMLKPEAGEAWWDLSSRQLQGADFIVPPPGSQGSRGLNIAYSKNDDGTLTVYVLWHET